MEWTEGRKLASVTYNNKETAFEYNHEGLRIKKTLHDGSYIFYEIVDGVYVGETRYNASGSVAVYIRYILDEGNSPVGISLWYPATGGWTDYHFIKNLQGDVLEVYKVSDGSLAASYTYDSWGNILSQSGSLASINPFRYRSYYYDTQTWFYYLQSRYYDPAIGKFINADAVDYLGVGTSLTSYNLFAYCNNNPVNSCDPNGEFAIGAILGKAAIGAGINVLTTFVAAKVTGQDYTWKDAGVAALSGAIGSGNATKLKVIAGVVSGVYTGAMAYKNGASLGGALAAGVVSGAGTTFAVSNIAHWLKAPLGPVAAPVVDSIFSTSANTMAAVTYKVAVDSSKTNEPAYLAPPNEAQRPARLGRDLDWRSMLW